MLLLFLDAKEEQSYDVVKVFLTLDTRPARV